MTIQNKTISKVFDDLDQYRDWCRFEGKVFNEAALYNRKDKVWQEYQRAVSAPQNPAVNKPKRNRTFTHGK